MSTPAKKSAPRKRAVTKKTATKTEPTESYDSVGKMVADAKAAKKTDALPTPVEAAVAAAKKLYPEDVTLWQYQPRDENSTPILLPVTGIESGDKTWYFDLAQLPLLGQTWKWMDRAKVPKPIQRQTQSLPDDEYFEMFNKWFDVIKQGRLPKGAVTAEK